jgi:predicted small metal-binding protein
MKRFACGDVVPDCDASWARSSEDEILVEVARHAAEVHGITEPPPELVAAVRARITEV